MYITTDLFLPHGQLHSQTTCSPIKMPGRLDAGPGTPGTLGKRKRIGEAPDLNHAAFLKNKSSSFNLQDQMAVDPIAYPNFLTYASIDPRHPHPQDLTSDAQPPPRTRRKLAQPRAGRTVSSTDASSHASVPSKATIQAPCHRCHKTPLQKKDLDSYTDCTRCEQRTCVVCIRQCACRRKICADCSVEEGVDGDVYCLDCFGKIQDVGFRHAEVEGGDADRDMDES